MLSLLGIMLSMLSIMLSMLSIVLIMLGNNTLQQNVAAFQELTCECRVVQRVFRARGVEDVRAPRPHLVAVDAQASPTSGELRARVLHSMA